MENNQDFALPDGVEGNADSTFAQYNTPKHTELLAGIRLPAIDMSSFELNPSTIQMLGNNAFRGRPNEDPNAHLTRFKTMCHSIKRDNRLEVQFMSKNFPAHRTQAALSGIHSFKQDHGESLYDSWKRYKGYQKSCPHHGLDKNYLINTFFRGLGMDTKTLIRASCGGSIQNKSFAELEEHIEMMIQEEDAPNEYSRDLSRKGNDQTIHMVLEQLAVLNAKLEDSTRSSRTEHSTPTQEELGMYALDERIEGVNYVTNNPFSNPYNPGWKNNLNLSYKSNSVENPTSNNFRVSDNSNQRILNRHPTTELRDNPTTMLHLQFLQSQEKTNQEFRAQFTSIEAHFKNIDNQIAQLASAIQRPSGSLSGNSETNPRAHVNAITLRSGKQVDSGDPPMVEQGDSSRTTVLDTTDDIPELAYVPPKF
ncbi:PREDICTED: uncharacterized protein LOC104801623 [Tarenaya hassleriana]|uniref:uncharacterized protein LOC104801623 n=1 Tax=Tarenaya hassleriana TaxID=28532 RepID=UPI00053C898D|nr:PREDICTED: uncharacterized protein LOC104801623 [Tarenaya hassleriana]